MHETHQDPASRLPRYLPWYERILSASEETLVIIIDGSDGARLNPPVIYRGQLSRRRKKGRLVWVILGKSCVILGTSILIFHYQLGEHSTAVRLTEKDKAPSTYAVHALSSFTVKGAGTASLQNGCSGSPDTHPGPPPCASFENKECVIKHLD